LDKIWQGKWITESKFYGLSPINLFHREIEEGEKRKHLEKLKNRHMLVRKTFTITEDIKTAYLDITADDYYKLKINGKTVGEGPAPAYFFHYFYNRYLVENYLKEGENLISVHLYYQGLVNRVWNSGDYRQGMIAELFINDKLKLKSDKSWKYKITAAYQNGGITGYQTQFLENIDFNLIDKNWQQLDYDDRNWSNVCVNNSDDHKFYKQPTSGLDFYYIKPVKINKIKDNHYLIDFGQIIVGYFQMTAKGFKNERIEIRQGEELREDEDRVRYNLRSNCKYQEFITLSGGKDKLNFYDYKVFRYVEVIAHNPDSKALDPETFKALVRHYKFADENTTFYSSNSKLNRIWQICKNSVKYGTQYQYLDCPGREKGQYLGDALITGLAYHYLTGDLKLYKKAVADFALSSYISPGLMAVAPGGLMQEIADYSLQWPALLLKYYRLSGDKKFLRKMYPTAEKLLAYFKQFQRGDGLLTEVNEKWNLVDWPKNMRDNYQVKLEQLNKKPEYGCHNVINAFFVGMVKTINEIRDILSIEYKNQFSKLKQAFREAFYNQNKKLFVDTETTDHSAVHSNILPLLYGLAPAEAEKEIVDLIKEKGLKCGVYMAYYLLKALARVGEYSLIYNLIVNENKNSWNTMIKEGATTCFEVWSKEQKKNTSLLHPWASAPIIIIIEDLLGIELSNSGKRNQIKMTPHLPAELDRIKFTMQNKDLKIEIKKDSSQTGFFISPVL